MFLSFIQFIFLSDLSQISLKKELGQIGDEFLSLFSPDMDQDLELVNLLVSFFFWSKSFWVTHRCQKSWGLNSWATISVPWQPVIQLWSCVGLSHEFSELGQSIIQRMRVQLTLPTNELICWASWASPWMGRTLWVRYSHYQPELLFVILSLMGLPQCSSLLLLYKIKQTCLNPCGLIWPVWLVHLLARSIHRSKWLINTANKCYILKLSHIYIDKVIPTAISNRLNSCWKWSKLTCLALNQDELEEITGSQGHMCTQKSSTST